MSRTALLMLLLALAGKITNAELREFTSSDGKTIIAEVEGFEGTSVKLKVGANTFKVPVSKLSEPDKDYLREWLKNNVQYAFRFSVFDKDGPSSLRVKENSDTYASRTSTASIESTESSHYLVNITNDSSQDLEKVELHYRVFVKQTIRMGFSGTNKSYYQLAGVTEITELPKGTGTLVPTSTITLENRAGTTTIRTTVTNTSTGSTSSYSNTRKNRARPDLMGIWYRIYHEGKLVGEYKDLHDDVEKSAPIWDDEAKTLDTVMYP